MTNLRGFTHRFTVALRSGWKRSIQHGVLLVGYHSCLSLGTPYEPCVISLCMAAVASPGWEWDLEASQYHTTQGVSSMVMFPTIRPNHGCGCTREGRAAQGDWTPSCTKSWPMCRGDQPGRRAPGYLLRDVKLHIHQAGGSIKTDDARHRNKYLFNQEN